jgi:hypothetical protein
LDPGQSVPPQLQACSFICWPSKLAHFGRKNLSGRQISSFVEPAEDWQYMKASQVIVKVPRSSDPL